MKKTIFLTVFIAVFKIVFSQTGHVYVGQAYNGKVAKIDPFTNTVIQTYTIADSIGTANHSITDLVADTLKSWLYVASSANNSIGMVDLNTGQTNYPLPTITGMGRVPIGLAINSTGNKLYVTTRGPSGNINSNNPLEIYNIVGSAFPPVLVKQTEIPVGKHPINVILDHTEQYAIVSCRNQPSLVVVNLLTNTIVLNHILPLGSEPEGLVLHPVQNIVYCTNHGNNSITILDINSMAVVNTFNMPVGMIPPAQPSSGMFTPDGNKFVLLGQTSNKLYYFNTSNPLNPAMIGIPVNCGGFQPHKGVFINDSIAYIPNTNNTVLNGSVAFFNINNYNNAIALSQTFYGPLGMVYLRNNSSATLNETNKAKSGIEIFPNPVNSLVNIRNKKEFDICFKISNAMGQTIIQEQKVFSNSEIKIELDKKHSGLLIIQVYDNQNRISESFKIINLQ